MAQVARAWLLILALTLTAVAQEAGNALFQVQLPGGWRRVDDSTWTSAEGNCRLSLRASTVPQSLDAWAEQSLVVPGTPLQAENLGGQPARRFEVTGEAGYQTIFWLSKHGSQGATLVLGYDRNGRAQAAAARQQITSSFRWKK